MNRALLFTLSFLVGHALPQASAPPKPLEVRECVEVMADYDVRHVPATPGLEWYGITDFEAHAMWLVQDVDLAQRRVTAIHELTHVVLHFRGDERFMDEDIVRPFVKTEYVRLFGSQ